MRGMMIERFRLLGRLAAIRYQAVLPNISVRRLFFGLAMICAAIGLVIVLARCHSPGWPLGVTEGVFCLSCVLLCAGIMVPFKMLPLGVAIGLLMYLLLWSFS